MVGVVKLEPDPASFPALTSTGLAPAPVYAAPEPVYVAPQAAYVAPGTVYAPAFPQACNSDETASNAT